MNADTQRLNGANSAGRPRNRNNPAEATSAVRHAALPWFVPGADSRLLYRSNLAETVLCTARPASRSGRAAAVAAIGEALAAADRTGACGVG